MLIVTAAEGYCVAAFSVSLVLLAATMLLLERLRRADEFEGSIKELKKKLLCQNVNCRRLAKGEVVGITNSGNIHLGRYCEWHGELEVDKAIRAEKPGMWGFYPDHYEEDE